MAARWSVVVALLAVGGARSQECTQSPRITGLIDGDAPGTNHLPKVLQIYFPCETPASNANAYSVTVHHRAGTRDTQELTSVSSQGFVYVSPEVDVFKSFVGKSPSFVNDKFYITGTDAVELSMNGERVDIYGAPQGTLLERAKWEFTQGSAERIYGTPPCSARAGNLSDWVIRPGKFRLKASILEAGGADLVAFLTCTSYPCPGGRHKPGNFSCAKRLCDKSDCETCCATDACTDKDAHFRSEETPNKLPADCSRISCPPGYVIKPRPQEIPCLGGVCNDLDLNTCCSLAVIAPEFLQDPSPAEAAGVSSMASAVEKRLLALGAGPTSVSLGRATSYNPYFDS